MAWALTDNHRRQLLDLARGEIRAKLDPAVSPPPEYPLQENDPVLASHAGVFVTLHEMTTEKLRGCIGHIAADRPMIQAVRLAACGVLEDPRFTEYPVQNSDLARLEIELTLTSETRPVPSPLDFDPLRHGIYLTVAGRSGLFLPQVARRTGWDRQTLLNRLCKEKMDLPAGSWRNPDAKLDIFDVEIIGPEPFVRHAP